MLGEFQSQSLVSDLRVINKVSQNLHAELMLRLLGREKGAAGTIEAGSEVVRGFLSQADIRSDEYAFYDGSGLSRQNLVTPHAIVKLLLYDSRQPWALQFDDTLPVAGVDGSLTERFRGTAGAGPRPRQNRLAEERECPVRLRHHVERPAHRVLHHGQQSQPAPAGWRCRPLTRS